jgi:nucleotide-binding universal stress UspA family protein
MDIHQPVVLALPLDETTGDLVDAGARLARALGTQLVPVFATSRGPARKAFREEEEAHARERLRNWLAGPVSQGLAVAEPVIEPSDPAALVLRIADLTGAQLIVAGHGRGATVQQWLLGSTTDRLVRGSRVPVFVARGTLPGPGKTIVCAVDGSPHSRTGLYAALRMARLFHAPLLVITAVDAVQSVLIRAEQLVEKAEEMEAAARKEAEELLASVDTSGVEVKLDVRAGRPAEVIIDASREAHLVVLASRSFDHLVPMSTGNVTERVVRGVRCSVLAVRDARLDLDARERSLQHVAELRRSARARRERGDHVGAAESLRIATTLAPTHAGLEEELADALEASGKPDEASRHREVAAMIRERLG